MEILSGFDLVVVLYVLPQRRAVLHKDWSSVSPESLCLAALDVGACLPEDSLLSTAAW